MTLDIQPGDTLVSGATEYAITAVGDWTWEGPASPAMRRRMTTTYSTKRPPAVSGGARGVAVTSIASLAGTPIDVVSPQVAAELQGGDYRYVTIGTVVVQDGEGRYLILTVEAVRR